MPTLKEIYEGQSNWVFGTNYTSVKPDKDTVIEQETSGIRIKSAVELNNPLIYGNEAIRIANRSTSSVEKMKQATGGTAGDGGLIGQGLGKITEGKFGKFVFGGKVTSLNQARDGINSRLGIPNAMIPTYVDGTGELQKGIEPDTMITLAKIRKDASGTEFGKFLKQTGGGNFRNIGRNILGQGISLVKDKLRDTLFGSPAGLGENEPTNGGYEYSSVNPYSTTIRNNKLNEPENDKLQLLQSQTPEKIDELKSKTKNLLNKNKPVGETSPSIEYTDEQPYSTVNLPFTQNDSTETNLTTPDSEVETDLKKETTNSLNKLKNINEKVEDKSTDDSETYSDRNQTFVVKDSRETNLSVPSEESNTEKKQDTDNALTENKPLGEEQEREDYSNDNKYRNKTLQEVIEDQQTGTFTRIDLSSIPGHSLSRKKPTLVRARGAQETQPGQIAIVQNNGYDSDVYYTRTVDKGTHEQRGLSSNRGDFINSAGFSKNGEYKDGDVVYTKSEMEGLDLIPLWISGLDSSSPIFFRTIITGLTETVTPSWSNGKFVGNPYNYYTYDGVERNVTFNLNLYCMNEYELMKNWERVTYLTSKAYPTIKNNLVYPPFIRFRLGDIYNDKVGFIDSLSYTMPDNGNWETELDGSLLPKFVEVALTIKFVEVPGDELSLYSYVKSNQAQQQIKQELNQNTEESVSGAPVTNGDGGTNQDTPIVVDKTGKVTEKAPEEEKSNQGKSKGVTNINTGKKESTPQIQNDTTIDGVRTISFESEADITNEERYEQVRKVVSDDDAAMKLARRYANPRRYLLEINKESETVYRVKEELTMKDGTNKQFDYAYHQSTYYGNMSRKIVSWNFTPYDRYLREKGEPQVQGGVFNSPGLDGQGLLS